MVGRKSTGGWRGRAAPKLGTLAICGVAGILFSAAAQADIGLSKDGIFNGYGYKTDLVDIEVYGILDVGVANLDHSYAASNIFGSTVNPYNLNSSPKSFTGFYSGGISWSRVGLKGETRLGSDVTLFFKVETGIDAITGNLSNNGRSVYLNIGHLTTANGASAIDGQWFSRAAYVGLSHPVYGSLEFGRTTNFSLDQVVVYDPVQNALLFSPLGFSGGIGGGLGATENTRLDNSLKYQNRIGNVDFGLQGKTATSTTDQEAESAVVGMLGYSMGPFSFMATASKTENTVAYATQYSNVVAPDPNLQIEDTRGFMVSSLYKITDEATAKIGYENTVVTAPSNLNLKGSVKYYGLTLPDMAVNATGKQTFGTFWTGGDYKILKDLDLAAGYYNVDTYNSPNAGKDYRANIFSLLADYTICKGLDTYAGAMLSRYSGQGLVKKAPIDAYGHNAVYGAGIRLKF
jgi:predicted porin